MNLHICVAFAQDLQYISWDKDLNDFPKVLNFDDKNWEWVMYELGPQPAYDYTVRFVPISESDYRHSSWAPKFVDLKWGDGPQKDPCECGAKHTSFKNHHMFYCPEYKQPKKRFT